MKKIIWTSVFLFFTTLLTFSMGASPEYAYGERTSSSTTIISFLPVLIIVIILVALAFSGKNKGGPALVLREFKLNEEENEFLKISGRSPGLFSWILSTYGIDPIKSLSCNKQAIKFEEAAIRYGKRNLNIPLAAVTCVSSGIYKPFSLLILSMIFVIGGIIVAILIHSFGIFIIGLIIGVIFLVFYSLKKTIQFGIYAGGITPIITINLKKSIIEGQNIDTDKYEMAASVLNEAILKRKQNVIYVKSQNNGT